MDWLMPALCAFCCWGVGQVFIKKGLTNISPFVSNVFFAFSAMVITISYALLLGGINWDLFPQIILFGIVASLPNLVLPYVLEKADVSLAGTILATYPIYTIGLSILFLKEVLSLQQVLAIGMIISGMILVMKPGSAKFRFESWLLFALFGSLIIGFGDFIGKVSLTKYNLSSFLIAYSFGYIPSLLFIRFFDRSKIDIKVKKNTKGLVVSMIGNFLMPLGLMFLYVAFSKGPASLASPVASAYPALTAILAFYFLKEKIGRSHFIGIVLVTVGIIFTSFQ